MEATYHGEPVDMPNYAGETLVEMQLLIGNNIEESFELMIKSIEVNWFIQVKEIFNYGTEL